jgi:ketosteroid isomerase-like protein
VPDGVDALRRAYEALHDGDLERGLEELAADVRWAMPAADGLPVRGVFHRRDEVRWMWIQLRAAYGDEVSARPVEFVGSEGTVVVIGDFEGGRDGSRFRVPYSTVWRFNELGQPHRAVTLFDTAFVRDALAAGGGTAG